MVVAAAAVSLQCSDNTSSHRLHLNFKKKNLCSFWQLALFLPHWFTIIISFKDTISWNRALYTLLNSIVH